MVNGLCYCHQIQFHYFIWKFSGSLARFACCSKWFFSHEAELDFGKRAGQWSAAFTLEIKDNVKLAYYNLLLFLPSFRCDCNLALKSFSFSFSCFFLFELYKSFIPIFLGRGGRKKKCIYIMYMLSSFFKSLLYNILFLAFVVSLMCDNRWSQFLFFVNLWHFNVIL